MNDRWDDGKVEKAKNYKTKKWDRDRFEVKHRDKEDRTMLEKEMHHREKE